MGTDQIGADDSVASKDSGVVGELDGGMSKTLHAGLSALAAVCRSSEGLTVTQVAEAIGVHRTAAHRIMRTLESHRVVRRDTASKRFFAGAGLVPLAEPVERDLRALAVPVLQELADSVGATAHLVLQEGPDLVRAMFVVEPRHAAMHIAFRAGQLDRIDRGSAGLALLAADLPRPGEREEVTTARERGYAVSFSEVISSVYGVSAVVPTRRHTPMSIGVSVFELGQAELAARAVLDGAGELGRALS